MPVELDWSTAVVSDGDLTVELRGELTEEWQRSFQTTVKLLGGPEVELNDDAVKVTHVEGGEEERLRHHLEALVDQANAAQEQDEAGESEAERESSGPDAELTERFRSFAGEEPTRD